MIIDDNLIYSMNEYEHESNLRFGLASSQRKPTLCQISKCEVWLSSVAMLDTLSQEIV